MDRRAVLCGFAASLAQPSWAQAPVFSGLVDAVQRSRLRETVFTLAGMETRWSNAPIYPSVELWMAEAFAATSSDQSLVYHQPFTMPSGKTRSNIGVRDPNDGREIVLVGAHLDSISEIPDQRAPGANDNATGIAAMLEAFRILNSLPAARQIVPVAFSGEEQGLVGSTWAAEVAAAEGWPIALMLNLDTLAHRPADPNEPMIIEFDQGNAHPGNNAAAASYGRRAAELAAIYTTLPIAHSDIWASDYMPFEARGFPCIGLYDNGANSPHNHRSTDTADRIDYARLEQATRLAVAVLADVAGVAV